MSLLCHKYDSILLRLEFIIFDRFFFFFFCRIGLLLPTFYLRTNVLTTSFVVLKFLRNLRFSYPYTSARSLMKHALFLRESYHTNYGYDNCENRLILTTIMTPLILIPFIIHLVTLLWSTFAIPLLNHFLSFLLPASLPQFKNNNCYYFITIITIIIMIIAIFTIISLRLTF